MDHPVVSSRLLTVGSVEEEEAFLMLFLIIIFEFDNRKDQNLRIINDDQKAFFVLHIQLGCWCRISEYNYWIMAILRSKLSIK
jgi:hypothetical protein